MTVRTLLGIALLCGALSVVRPARAQDVATPPIVTDGFRALLASGIDKGVEVWFKGSALEGDASKANPFSRAFTELPSWLGKTRDFEILKTYATGAHIRRTYAILLFEGGPAYWRFDYFLGSKGWMIQHIDFNTDADKILPTALMPP